MNREIDYFCLDCGQPVYKTTAGCIPISHVCKTLEEFKADERRRRDFERRHITRKTRWVIFRMKHIPEDF
ncbi:MAG TPA: hypothetical protein VF599_12645 [Pyrinomonadaceae bacterium]|jgi:hypothetical protein